MLSFSSLKMFVKSTKLGMTISEHNVLKNSNNFKEHQFYEILYMWSKLLKRVNLILLILLEYLK